jgi:hypothetical protein
MSETTSPRSLSLWTVSFTSPEAFRMKTGISWHGEQLRIAEAIFGLLRGEDQQSAHQRLRPYAVFWQHLKAPTISGA